MAQDVRELVKGRNIADLVYRSIIEACKQMQDVWPVLQEEERDRMINLAQASAEAVERDVATRIGGILDQFIASGQPSVAAVEKGIAIEGSGVTIKLAAVRSQVPQAFFTHKGQFLIVLTDGDVLSLEELNRQGDFFDNDPGPSPAADLADQLREDSPIVAQFKASQAAAEERVDTPDDPAELFLDHFLLALGQLMPAEQAKAYDVGGEFHGVVGIYWAAGWTPGEAAANESIDPQDPARRLASDGPVDPPVDGDGEAAA